MTIARGNGDSLQVAWYAAYLVSFLAAFGLVRWAKFSLDSEAVKDFCTFLATISGMVFTIMGIWIAFLYPNALLKFSSPEKIENIDFSYGGVEAKRLSYIVSSILVSCIIMMILGGYFFMRIFSHPFLDFNSGLALNFRSFFSGGLAMLFLMQIRSVFSVIFANIMFLNDIHERRKNIIIDND